MVISRTTIQTKHDHSILTNLIDLLRKYGFVDVPNPFNIAEISGESLVNKCVAEGDEGKDLKVEFLLEQDALEE
jgi:SET domain-containing protein 6